MGSELSLKTSVAGERTWLEMPEGFAAVLIILLRVATYYGDLFETEHMIEDALALLILGAIGA